MFWRGLNINLMENLQPELKRTLHAWLVLQKRAPAEEKSKKKRIEMIDGFSVLNKSLT